MKFIYFLLSIIIFSSCKKDKNLDVLPEGTIKYEVTFDFNWSSTSFPDDYPSNAHFSKFIGWSHQLNHDFLKVGTLASQGIKDMAEKGKTTPLDSEINTKIENGEGLKLFIGDNLPSGVGQIKMIVYVDAENPSISLVSMLAPSPDWYLGVVNVNLLEGNKFVDTKTVKAIVYDAGTDSGVSYKSSDMITNPQDEIYVFKSDPLGENVKNIANVTFKKID